MRIIQKQMQSEKKTFARVIEGYVKEKINSKAKAKAIMKKMQTFIALQAHLYYGEELPNLPGLHEMMQETINDQDVVIDDLLYS